MFHLGLLALIGLQQVSAAPALTTRSDLPTSDHILELQPVNVQAPSSQALLAGKGIAPLKPFGKSEGYSVQVSVDGQKFNLLLDTGSADVWVFDQGVQCVDNGGNPVSNSQCGFGPTFKGSITPIPGLEFVGSYADGEVVSGPLAAETVTVAGVTVTNQDVGFVTEANVPIQGGQGGLSGIFGLARSAITSAFKGRKHVTYSAFIDTAIKEKAISPIFSVVLDRNGGGQLALGGLPTVSFQHTFATTPIKKIEIQPDPLLKTQYSYYTIIPDGLVIGSKKVAFNFPSVVDTGTTLLYLPTSVAAQVASAFSPPAKLVQGLYAAPCSAKAPKLGITIGGKTFFINPVDLLIPVGGSTCLVGVVPTTGKVAILGDVFLRNVVAVFDLGKEVVQFAPHENY